VEKNPDEENWGRAPILEKKAAAWENKSAGNHQGKGKTNTTLKIGSVYHVMKSTSIIMRALGPNLL
jgi:hypothetical protein